MLRREFVRWLVRLTGGYFVVNLAPGLSPLKRINTTLFSEAQAQDSCTDDTCTTQDDCGATDTEGHTCAVKDVCNVDASGNCMNDECQSDSSGACASDVCTTDSSKSCTDDNCEADSSGSCNTDQCNTDKSGDCTEHDVCVLDESASCKSDVCREDKSPDTCAEEADCTNDTCAIDLAMNDTKTSRRRFAKAGIERMFTPK